MPFGRATSHTTIQRKSIDLITRANNKLLYNAERGDVRGVLSALQEGADINTQDWLGWTPLLWAAGEGHSKVCETLLLSGAAINQQNKAGNTALHRAVYCGHKRAVEILLKFNAKKDLPNIEGKTSIQIAIEQKHSSLNDLMDVESSPSVESEHQSVSTNVKTTEIKTDETINLKKLIETIQENIDAANSLAQQQSKQISQLEYELKILRGETLDIMTLNEIEDLKKKTKKLLNNIEEKEIQMIEKEKKISNMQMNARFVMRKILIQ